MATAIKRLVDKVVTTQVVAGITLELSVEEARYLHKLVGRTEYTEIGGSIFDSLDKALVAQ